MKYFSYYGVSQGFVSSYLDLIRKYGCKQKSCVYYKSSNLDNICGYVAAGLKVHLWVIVIFDNGQF